MTIVSRLRACLLLALVFPAGAAPAEPTRAPAPALTEELRACPGGFRLPGSATCLRIGGRVSAETTLRTGSSAPARSALVRNRVQTRVDLDVRTPTELGPVRVFTSIRSPSGGLR